MRPLHIDILTLFPGFFTSPLETSILRRAIDKNLVEITLRDFRDFARGKYQQVDDMPYGGGPGMVLMLEPLAECLDSIIDERRLKGLDPVLVITCPRGERLNQKILNGLASPDPENKSLLILAGHYEGYDERLYGLYNWKVISLGDFILSGGEIPALTIIDGIARLLEGTLGNLESLSHESFDSGMLDHPVYTRPPEFRGMRVPEVLTNGDHAKIETWRAMKRRELTERYRPDLMEKFEKDKDQ